MKFRKSFVVNWFESFEAIDVERDMETKRDNG